MRACIITGGSMSDYAYIRRFLQPDDCIVAADSGYLHALALGVTPTVLVGDFDSLGTLPSNIPLAPAPREKDETDTELAIRWARAHGCTQFLLLGATGTRLDHTLANVFSLTHLLAAGESAQIVDEHNEIWITNDKIQLPGTMGNIISLVPLSTCHGVTSTGLAYPLTGDTLQVGHGRTISNVQNAPIVTISLTSGTLLVIRARD